MPHCLRTFKIAAFLVVHQGLGLSACSSATCFLWCCLCNFVRASRSRLRRVAMKTQERVTDARTRVPNRKTKGDIGIPVRATKATRLALVTGLGLVVVAAPSPGLAVG